MTLAFPVPPTWPAANWVSEPALPVSPITSTTMSNGAVSRLRLSTIQVGAEFTASWQRVTLTQLNSGFMPFWRSVDLWDDFTLASSWWNTSCPADLKTLIESCSPTGRWIFAEAPIIQELSVGRSYSVIARIKGVID
jgi:hypothetical protein